jgi:hypothetical protein
MRSTGLRALFGAICAFVLTSGVVQAKPHGSSQPQAAGIVVPSPDRRHRITLVEGRLRLDGHPVAAAGKPLGRPVWRSDSRAVAFLQRCPTGLQLSVVLLDVDPWKPIIWSLPTLADSSRQIFWIGPQRIGVGDKTLVPRLVVTWTTTLV